MRDFELFSVLNCRYIPKICVPVRLNLLNALRKSDKMLEKPRIYLYVSLNRFCPCYFSFKEKKNPLILVGNVVRQLVYVRNAQISILAPTLNVLVPFLLIICIDNLSNCIDLHYFGFNLIKFSNCFISSIIF